MLPDIIDPLEDEQEPTSDMELVLSQNRFYLLSLLDEFDRLPRKSSTKQVVDDKIASVRQSRNYK
jgi:hypothetical protein